MNYLVLAMIVLTVLPIVAGFLIGLIRGIKRSVARAVTIVLCVVAAWLLCGVVSNAVLNAEMPGQGMVVKEYLMQQLTEMMSGIDLSDIILPFVQSLVKVLMFVILFWALQFLTWIIVTPICSAVFRGKDKRKGKVKPKRHRLIGSVIGAVQGLAVALVICMVFSGMFTQVGRLFAMAQDLPQAEQSAETYEMSSEDETAPEGEGSEAMSEVLEMFSGYADSGVGKFYQSLTGKPFEWLSSVTTDKGDTVTLPELVDSMEGVARMAREVVKMGEIDFAAMMSSGDFSDLKEILGNLDAIKGDLSEQALETINGLLQPMGEALDLPIDLSSLDLNTVEFAKEGEIIENLYGYTQANAEELTVEDAKDIVKQIGESQLILPVVQSASEDITSSLTEEQTDFISSAIDSIEEEQSLSQDKIDALREIFGL